MLTCIGASRYDVPVPELGRKIGQLYGAAIDAKARNIVTDCKLYAAPSPRSPLAASCFGWAQRVGRAAHDDGVYVASYVDPATKLSFLDLRALSMHRSVFPSGKTEEEAEAARRMWEMSATYV